jgi:opacity protein-like surface antigen
MKYKKVISLLLLFKLSYISAFAQSGTADRDEYFRRMELRAIELSRKMAELTGSEPVNIIKPRAQESIDLRPADDNAIFSAGNSAKSSSGNSVQDSYDALPGPEENNQSTPVKQYEDKVGEGSLFSQSTTEELKGSYYLRPSFVFQAPFDSVVKGVDYSLPGKPGQGIGVVVGRRIENWTLSARFGHTHQEFSNSEILPGTGISVAGDVETMSLTANVGVTVPLNQKLSFEASFGLGYTSVSHSHNMVIVTSNLDVLSDSGFSYELSLLLDYSFSERLSAFLGYRLAGIPENNGSNIAFESVNAHLFELGLGMNF